MNRKREKRKRTRYTVVGTRKTGGIDWSGRERQREKKKERHVVIHVR